MLGVCDGATTVINRAHTRTPRPVVPGRNRLALQLAPALRSDHRPLHPARPPRLRRWAECLWVCGWGTHNICGPGRTDTLDLATDARGRRWIWLRLSDLQNQRAMRVPNFGVDRRATRERRNWRRIRSNRAVLLQAARGNRGRRQVRHQDVGLQLPCGQWLAESDG